MAEPKKTVAEVNADLRETRAELEKIADEQEKTSHSLARVEGQMENVVVTVNRLSGAFDGLQDFRRDTQSSLAATAATLAAATKTLEEVAKDIKELTTSPLISVLHKSGLWALATIVAIVGSAGGAALWVNASINVHAQRIESLEKSVQEIKPSLASLKTSTDNLATTTAQNTIVAQDVANKIKEQTAAIARLNRNSPAMRQETVRVTLMPGKAYKGEKEGVMLFAFTLPRPIPEAKLSQTRVTSRLVSFPHSYGPGQESPVQLWSNLTKDGKALEIQIAAPGIKTDEILRSKPPAVVEATITIAE